MNVNLFNYQSVGSPSYNIKKQKNEDSVNCEGVFSSVLNHKMDSLTDKFLNITDSMSREDKVSFAASVIADKFIGNALNDEDKTFLKQISGSFTDNELEKVRDVVKNTFSNGSKSEQEISEFFKVFDNFISDQKNQRLNRAAEAQRRPINGTTSDMFFRAALLGI